MVLGLLRVAGVAGPAVPLLLDELLTGRGRFDMVSSDGAQEGSAEIDRELRVVTADFDS